MPPESPPRAKEAWRVAAGKKTAAKRWGPDGRICRLDALDPITRQIIIAILHAREAAKAEPDGSAT